MIAELVQNNGRLCLPEAMRPVEGFYPHHFMSSDGDNLIELAGRVCYDSTKLPKSRTSIEYHKHINETNHGSVQEHYVVTLTGNFNNDQSFGLMDINNALANRPGTWVWVSSDGYFEIQANIRAIREWFKWTDYAIHNAFFSDKLGHTFQYFAKQACHLAMDAVVGQQQLNLVACDSKLNPWYSYYIGGVSRGLTHELVRHKYMTAISQRSTRYVDESESEWAWHPLMLKHQNKILKDICEKESHLIEHRCDHENCNVLQENIVWSRFRYKVIVDSLEEQLIAEGNDKFTARKQARGAARGILGNALSTELIFTASLQQWKRIILMRCSNAADAEIRMLCSQIFDDLVQRDIIKSFNIGSASDSIGYHITSL